MQKIDTDITGGAMNTHTFGLSVWCIAGTIGLVVASPTASACSCAPVSVQGTWHESSDVLLGRVLGERLGREVVRYRVMVEQPFSGCTAPGQVVAIETPLSGASCGTRLRVGETYV